MNISKRDFYPMLGMSYSLKTVLSKKMPGNPDVLRESLEKFKEEFAPYKPWSVSERAFDCTRVAKQGI